MSSAYQYIAAGGQQSMGLVGSVISNRRNRIEAEKMRKFNAAQANKNRAFNREESVRARSFERMMSGTAYQRASMDLQKAGLNRILAFGSPASTPGGNRASGTAASGGAAPQSFDFGDPIGTAVQVARAKADIGLTQQNTRTSAAGQRLADAKAVEQEKKNQLEGIKGDAWKKLRDEVEGGATQLYEGTKSSAKKIIKKVKDWNFHPNSWGN